MLAHTHVTSYSIENINEDSIASSSWCKVSLIVSYVTFSICSNQDLNQVPKLQWMEKSLGMLAIKGRVGRLCL